MIHEPLPVPAAPDEPQVVARRAAERVAVRGLGAAVRRARSSDPTPPLAAAWAHVHHPDAPIVGPNALRNRLLAVDAVAVASTWVLVLALGPERATTSALSSAATIGLLVVTTIAVLAAEQLYRGRIGSVRRVARRRLAAGALVAPCILVVTGAVSLATDGWAAWLVIGALVGTLALVVGREVFEQWLRSARVRGHHVRPILVGGTAHEVAQLVRLLDAHPEVGGRAVGWVGPEAGRPRPPELALVPWLGPSDRIAEAAALLGTAGVLIAPSVAGDPAFGELARTLQAQRLHVQVSTGLWGIDPARLRTSPLAHEPCFYLEPCRQGPGPKRIKRVADVVLASVVLVLTAPVLAVAALAVKLHDGGPVIFRQVRIGLGGEPFELHKFRTMGVDAERRLAALAARNERSGPLFKIDRDPRVTPIGRVLRATSIDELPQLVDVLLGRLSLVGPRPALPDEVAAFDAPLRERHRVLPGVTGLWQVEARHNPSFDAYRHLDLFYVENWTLGLDVAILAATVKTVLTDGARALMPRRHDRHTDATADFAVEVER